MRLRSGAVLAKGRYADLDEFTLSEIADDYRLLVLRRSPVASRPSSRYELASRGTWYDVWRRIDGVAVRDHLPLGGPLDPLGVAPCPTVRLVAKSADQLLTPTLVNSSVEGFHTVPTGWIPSARNSGIVTPTAGTASVRISVPADGTYGVWVGGSFRGTMRMKVDSIPAGSLFSHINPVGMWVRTGSVQLTTGQHVVTVELTRSRLRPGNGGTGFFLGPVALAQEPTGVLETHVPTSAGDLCGTRLDWIEAIAG